MALSLYRKYRPNVFADVVGQQHVERTLVNAVTEGNVAHAYLFCGPRGTGKTTTARLLAKALLCENGPNAEPDGTCPQCTDIAQGSHPDVYELDAASRTGVENVREEIIGRVNFAPTRGRSKIYIIDEVHMLSTAAFNALLKTLEEPPDHVVFVLCTTDPQKVPETIQSRCQRFDFKRLSIEEIIGYLKRICAGEGFTYEEEALEYLAAKSNGGMRDATTSLEQIAVFADGAITLKATSGLFGQMDTSGLFAFSSSIGARDTAACFERVAALVESGIDLAQFAHDLAQHFRDLYATALTGGEGGIVACPASELPKYQQQAQAFGAERLSRALTVCNELIAELRWSTDARLSVEVACTRLCRPESDLTLEALSERIAQLERGSVVATTVPAAAFVAQAEPGAWEQPAQAQQVESTRQPEPEAQARPQQAEPVHQAEPAPWEQPAPQAEPARQAEPQHAEPATFAEPVRQAEPQRVEPAREVQPAQREEQHAQPAAWEQPQHTEPMKQEQPRQAEPAPWEQPAPQAEPVRQPEPQPQPQPQPQAARTSMSPARIFQALLTEVKREDVATGALLNGVSLVQDGANYYLEFPASAQFAMNIAMKGTAHELILRAFTQIAGPEPQLELRLAGIGSQGDAQPEPSYGGSDFGGYSQPQEDDGYFDALSASAQYYSDEPAGDSYGGGGGSFTGGSTPFTSNDSAPVIDTFAEPNFDDPFAAGAKPIDAETAASLADTLSAFGTGIKLTEVDE